MAAWKTDILASISSNNLIQKNTINIIKLGTILENISTFLNSGSIIILSPLINAIKTTPVIYPIDNGGCFFVRWYNSA